MRRLHRPHTTRRHFMRALGTAALGLPFLPSLLPRTLRAQPVAGPKRLLCIFTHNHQERAFFLPEGTESAFTLSPVLAPLEPFQDRMLVLHNLTSTFHDHPGGGRCLTEAEEGVSIDQLVSRGLGNVTRIRSFELGVQGTGSRSFSAPGVRVPAIAHPHVAYARLIGAATGDPEAEVRTARQTARALETLSARYAALSARLSPSERRLVDAHVAELRDLHDRVSSPAMVRACDIPPEPAVPSGSESIRDPALFPDVTRAHLDILATAFACDVTRVGTLVMSRQNTAYSWLGISDITHDLAHGFRNADGTDITAFEAEWSRLQTWNAEQIAYLVAKLDAIPEGDGTVLDNTVVYWVSELGLGNRGEHSRRNLPAVLIGGCGDYFRTARFLDMGGRPHADLLLTLAHAMGLTDVSTFGLDGTAPLDALRS